MGGLRAQAHDRLIIFCRYPAPGRTKTRLIPVLGPTGAAELHRWLTEKTFETIKAIALRRRIGVEVRFDGGSELKMRRWLGPGAIFSRQGEGDLGERMHAAFVNAFQSGCRRVVLLGTDIPGLNKNHLGKAFAALAEQDLVLGPSTDGGYWLMGLRRPAHVFQGINWGTEKVLEQTIVLAKRHGLTVHQLDPLTDIDTEDDFKRWQPKGIWQRPYVSIIIPVLNEAVNVRATIRAATDDDAEIIVVDGGSMDDTVLQAADAGAQVEISPQCRATQQNRGAEAASGSILLFVHADTLLPNGFVYHVFETLMDPSIIVGAFRFKSDLDSPSMKVIEFLTNFRSQYLRLPYGDQGLFIRKTVFESFGGFPNVPIAEDLFFVRRLSKRGKIRIAPANAVTSSRRWQTLGVLRTTLINQLIVAGCYLGVSPHTLASLYKIQPKK
jgi:rSAM/selenodomain-associated transferase 2/rSAM/selenodomain-associated transferase 1